MGVGPRGFASVEFTLGKRLWSGVLCYLATGGPDNRCISDRLPLTVGHKGP